MLSRDELLEIEEYNNGTLKFYNNKIVISNKEKDDSHNAIVNRNETSTILASNYISRVLDKVEPMFKELFDSNFEKPLKKLKDDIDNNGVKLLFNIISALVDEKNRDEKLLKLLKKYGFIRQSINSLDELGAHIESLFIPSKDGSIVNQDSIVVFNEVAKTIRELHGNYIYKKLYSSNQVLINSLSNDDNYRSRVLMFSDLYDAKIILSSESNSFIECTNCDPEVLKGAVSLKINPKKLERFTCPACNTELTFHAMYELCDEIFQIVKSSDGVLLDALCYLLKQKGIEYKRNLNYLKDIEIDSHFEIDNVIYLVESKMFKLNTDENKLKQKINESYGKLVSDVTRLIESHTFGNKLLKPILLVNLLEQNQLDEYSSVLEEKNRNNPITLPLIYNLKTIKAELFP